MSAIVGIFNGDRGRVDPQLLHRMLGRMPQRGADRADVWRDGAAGLGVARHAWEFGPRLAGPVLVVHDDTLAVAADASLYYRDDLRRKLTAAGHRPTGQTATHLILAAYRAWGERAPEHLEGDFAFVVWDRRARRVFAARDFVGSRPLYWARLGDAFVIASSVDAVLAHPDARRDVNLLALATEAAGLTFAVPAETAFAGVSRLDGGTSLTARAGGAPTVEAHWRPESRVARGASSFEDGAAELRDLLRGAVAERMDGDDDPTGLWLSGGWDSPAVFAAGQLHLGAERRRLLRAVSVSHPEGDSGCEDPKIREIAERWNAPVEWVQGESVSMLGPLFERTARRGEPVDHLFVAINVALAERTRAIGARVALDGNGGDVLFATSPLQLADKLARLQLGQLFRECRAFRALGHRPRDLARMAVMPNLPVTMLRALATVRRAAPPRSRFQRPVPFWIDRDAVRRFDLVDRAHAGGAIRRRIGDMVGGETEWFMRQPFYPRSRGVLSEAVQQAGVELRTPILDRRIVEFALARPRAERNTMGETKLLLRKSMEGLLPPSVLASRPKKTGTLNDYYTNSLRAGEATIREAIAEPLVLGELGLVDATLFRRGWHNVFVRDHTSRLRGALLSTLLVELWVREHLSGTRGSEQGPLSHALAG